MNASERRQAILSVLQSAETPTNAAALAKQFGVSRQIIVGDIALLRAAGEPILSTPRGYMLDRKTSNTGITRAVLCRHSAEEMERELNLMVDFGCTVVDVAIEHPVYGHLSGQLALSSRYDVAEFIRKVSQSDAKPLSVLTEGLHLHTLHCPSEAVYLRLLEELDRAGFLIQS